MFFVCLQRVARNSSRYGWLGGKRRKGKRLPEFLRATGKRLRETEWEVGTLGKDKMEKGAAAGQVFRRPP